jgi:predicted GH43/DUF377 family glycosyl hydrolase
MSRPTIALCMIVRDEAAIVERCLASVEGLIDTWVICDTGSTDGTQDLVRGTLEHLPGALHDTEWVDFGHNRTELMGLAEGTAEYLLLLDADMTVEEEGELPELDADAYLLRETGLLDFGVPRLVRGDRRWWYEGATHEHIATDGILDQRELPELRISHHADGSARWEKLIRDVALLKRDIARDPERPRPVFYLAQTMRDLGKRELAIATFRRRVEMGGWEEEVFYANLQEGLLRAEEDLAAGTPVLLEAWERRPARAEPLYELARLHRQCGDVAQAHLFATRGLEIPYPDDVLFVHRWAYEWGLRLERGLAAMALGRTTEAQDDFRQLVDDEATPEEIASFAAARIEELAQRREPLPAAADGDGDPVRLEWLAPSLRIGEIKLSVRPDWPCFNPSIAPAGDGFRVIVRTANYRIEQGVLHHDRILRNINYLAELDHELAVRAVEPIVDRSRGPQRHPSQIKGYEDCRLIEVAGRWYATATACDLNPDDRREIALLELDGPEISAVTVLAGPDPERHEKNWMPFDVDGVLHLLYLCGPTVVLRHEPETGAVEVVAEHDAPAGAEHFRGGSQGVPVPGGHLFAVHEVVRKTAKLRYVHRFVLLDEDFTLAGVSQPFTFTSDRVEFCAGMARRGDELVLSFGISDAAAGLAVIDLDDALALVEPPREGVVSAAVSDDA